MRTQMVSLITKNLRYLYIHKISSIFSLNLHYHCPQAVVTQKIYNIETLCQKPLTLQNRIWSSTTSEEKESLNGSREESERGTQGALGFNVKNAVLYPREAEKGIWPDDYTLSDHARLSVVLSPERMWCCQS